MNELFYVFILSVITIQYIYVIFSLTYNKKTVFMITYISYIYFYDYLFINASYFMNSLFLNLLKPLNEYLLFFLLLKLVKVRSKDIITSTIDKNMGLYLIVPSLIVLSINDFTNIDIGNTIQGIRTYLVPIIVPYLFYKTNFFTKIDINKIVNALFVFGVITVIYSYIQRENFNGSLKSLWFYDFFNQYADNPIDKGPFNFIRNDVLRATSFFVSPIINSLVLSVLEILALSMLLTKVKTNSNFMLVTLICIFLYGQVISETRIGLFISAIGFGILLVMHISKKRKSYFKLAVIPLLGIAATFGALIYGYTNDPSALGRLQQYGSFFTYFKPLGLGFNNTNVLTKFDTFYMSLALVYGVLFIFPVLFYVKMNRILFFYYKSVREVDFFLKFVIVISLVFVYTFAFQFTAATCPYRLFFLFIFMTLTIKKEDLQYA